MPRLDMYVAHEAHVRNRQVGTIEDTAGIHDFGQPFAHLALKRRAHAEAPLRMVAQGARRPSLR